MKSTSNFFILLVYSIIDEQEDAQNLKPMVPVMPFQLDNPEVCAYQDDGG